MAQIVHPSIEVLLDWIGSQPVQSGYQNRITVLMIMSHSPQFLMAGMKNYLCEVYPQVDRHLFAEALTHIGAVMTDNFECEGAKYGNPEDDRLTQSGYWNPDNLPVCWKGWTVGEINYCTEMEPIHIPDFPTDLDELF